MSKTTMICGKGGVGKTFTSTALAILFAQAGYKTALIDYDGGHSVSKTLGLEQLLTPNDLQRIWKGVQLWVAVIDQLKYIDIKTAQQMGMGFDAYMAQFKDDLGLMPWGDMPNSFFGVPTEPETLQRYLSMVMVLTELYEDKFDYIFVDIEPTAGFKRMIQTGPIIARGLANLREQSWFMLKALGAKWPDIHSFIESEYMGISDMYMQNMERCAEQIRTADYLLATIAEESPVGQTFQNRTIIEEFGGSAKACIINNLRGEPHEEEWIRRLEDHNLPIARVSRRSGMHTGGTDRVQLLTEVGHEINQQLRLLI